MKKWAIRRSESNVCKPKLLILFIGHIYLYYLYRFCLKWAYLDHLTICYSWALCTIKTAFNIQIKHSSEGFSKNNLHKVPLE